jgi:hypothetical protein
MVLEERVVAIDEAADFDVVKLWEAMDAKRRSSGLSWAKVMKQINGASHELDARLGAKNHPMSVATVRNMVRRRSTTCQHALGMLRWLDEVPETFVAGELGARNVSLPSTGSDRRLRWDIWKMADALDAERRSRGMTWKQLSGELRCTPSQVSSLRQRRYGISIQLAMRITRWLDRSSTDFVVAAEW